MSVVDFPPRSPVPARTVDALRTQKTTAHPACDITVRKADRDRRYAIRADRPGYFVGEVWFGRAQHRRRRVAGVFLARMLATQFYRELKDLIADGWTDGPA